MEAALGIIYIFLSAIYVLFVPGFVLSLLFFDLKKIDIIERLTLSFALSISIIPLLSYYLNFIGVKITYQSVFLEVLWLTVIVGLTYVFWHGFIKREK